MRVKKIPTIYRNVQDSSITLSYGKPKCSLIWLHGLCDNSEGFFSYFTHSHSPIYEGVKIKMIQAPLRNITINKGQVCHGWYDIMSTDRFIGDETKVFNFDDIKQSHEIIDSHIQQEVKEWKKDQPNSPVNPHHRVYVGGFSQGGVISLSYAMQSAIPPAGVISLSGYMLRTIPYTNFGKFPMLLMHGTKDPIIRQVMAKHSYQKILQAQNLTTYHSIDELQHSVNLQQLDIMKKWIADTFKTISYVYDKQSKKQKQKQKQKSNQKQQEEQNK